MIRVLSYIFWLFFPARCAVCGKILRCGEHICNDCSGKLEPVDKICITCGNDKKQCTCKWQVFRFRGCIGAFNKDDNSMAAIKNFKLGGNSYIADFLADHMVDKFKKHYADIHFDAVTAVPVHPVKKFFKGYNHSEMLARRLGKTVNLPYRELLWKIRFKKGQHNLNRKERFENIKGMFSAFLPQSAQTVLLVDDIKSTGATLDECTRALMYAGVKDVYCITAISNSGRNT